MIYVYHTSHNCIELNVLNLDRERRVLTNIIDFHCVQLFSDVRHQNERTTIQKDELYHPGSLFYKEFC